MKFLKLLLFPFALLYRMITGTRNFLYDKNLLKSVSFDIPIICVGNLSAGGTGKTPHTAYMIELLQDQFRTAVLSRGYGRKTINYNEADENATASTLGDEPMMYHSRYPKVKVAVDKRRISGIMRLMYNHPDTEVILLDDAFQHRAVRAGLNIIISPFDTPFYTDYILPMGFLRESKNGLQRADIVIISKCPNDLSEQDKNKITSQIDFPADKIFFSNICYGPVVKANENTEFKGNLKDSEVLLITGIANPIPLCNYLSKKNVRYKHLKFPDHHRFSAKDSKAICEIFDTFVLPSKIILTTEKDAMRLNEIIELKNLPIYVQTISTILDCKEKFDTEIINYVNSHPTSH